MKRNIIYLFSCIVVILTSCQSPEMVNLDTSRQAITSLTAIFTTGDYIGNVAAKCDITASDIESGKLVISVPWYYPVESNNETDVNMKAMRIEAVLNNNYTITPALTVLDLTKENFYTLTTPDGTKHEISISGKRIKSSECKIVTFSLKSPNITGIIDNSTKVISLISPENLSACQADFEISAHATISPNPADVQNYEMATGVKFTVTAHNGDTCVYTVRKEIPEKIPYGFNSSSIRQLFNLYTDNLGIVSSATNAPSMGVINNHLVVCLGNGTAPSYYNKITGVKIGTVVLGGLSASNVRSVTSDEANNLLFCNKAGQGQDLKIYITNDVTSSPVEYATITNNPDLTGGYPIGTKLKVIGNIHKNAIITLTCEGTSTVGKGFVRVVVTNGVVGVPEYITLPNSINWWPGIRDTPAIVAASTDYNEGYFFSVGLGNNIGDNSNRFTYANSSNQIDKTLPYPTTDVPSIGVENVNNLDSKKFNSINYVALFATSQFSNYGTSPLLFLYDVTDKSKLTGNMATSPALVFKNTNIGTFHTRNTTVATGDVLIAPSEDGYMMYIYYYDQNSCVIGGYYTDCIKR